MHFTIEMTVAREKEARKQKPIYKKMHALHLISYHNLFWGEGENLIFATFINTKKKNLLHLIYN